MQMSNPQNDKKRVAYQKFVRNMAETSSFRQFALRFIHPKFFRLYESGLAELPNGESKQAAHQTIEKPRDVQKTPEHISTMAEPVLKISPKKYHVPKMLQDIQISYSEEQTSIKLVHMKSGQKISEVFTVPTALIRVIAGESGMGPIEAMDALAKYFNDQIAPELDNAILTGKISIPASILASIIRESHSEYAAVAATTSQVSESLFLEDKEVDRRIRFYVALMDNVPVEQLEKLNLTDRNLWTERITTHIERTKEMGLKEKTIPITREGRPKTIKILIPEVVAVHDKLVRHTQTFQNRPNLDEALQDILSKIEELRGQPLGKSERNVVRTYISLNYIKDSQCWFPLYI